MKGNLKPKVGAALNKNASLILAGLSIGGFVCTIIFTAKGQSKADKVIAERDEYYRSAADIVVEREHADGTVSAEKFLSEEETVVPELSLKERFSLTWKCYVPAAISGVATIACVIVGNYISWKKIAALTGTVSILVTQRDEFEKRARAQFGDEAVDEIKNKMASDLFKKGDEREGPKKKEVVIVDAYPTGNGDLLCYDEYSGRHFLSSYDAVVKAEKDFNEGLLMYEYAGYDMLYCMWNVKYSDFQSNRGWYCTKNDDGQVSDSNCDPDRGVIFENIWSKVEGTDTPLLTIRIHDEPFEEYWEWY